MTDLFTAQPRPAQIGRGNAHFIADLAIGITDTQMRAKFTAGDYPDLHTASVVGLRRLAGRS